MRPVEAPTRVLIVPLGTVGRELMLEVAAAVRTVFGAKVLLAAAQHQPAYAFNKDRRQHHSTAILRRLALGRTDPELAVLGLTDADLFVPDMPFVFGEADRAAQAAVVSLARLASGPDGRPVPVERATRRVAVEAVHHLGLLLGLSQCEDVHCAMVVSHKPTDADRKGPGLCGACRSALGLATR